MAKNGFSSQNPRFIASNPDEIREGLAALGPVDIVVGIPSYNEADNIAFVVKQCDEGLRQYFPDQKGIIVNVDNDSQDDTKGAFLAVETETPKFYISTPEGVRGKGNNFFNLFQAAIFLKSKAVVCVDADLESIGPDWIDDLASPVVRQGADYVTPVYSRNEYDGAITNHICYPLIYGLMGREVRQPIGGDFGLSTRFATSVLSEEWEHTTHEYGIDIFLTLSAVFGGFRQGQTRLGAKIHKPSAPKLGPMITQVLTTLFSMLVENRRDWRWHNGGVATERTYGDKRLEPPQDLPVDYKAIKETALDGYETQRSTLKEFLSPKVFEKVDEIMVSGRMRLTSALWTRVVFDLLHAFDTSGKDERVIEAMKPLFFGRIASFIRYTLDLDHEESEVEIRLQAREFRRLRRYLKKRYNGAP
jgi:hypothetical protein